MKYFLKTGVQSFVIHQLLNTLRYLDSRDVKAVIATVKLIYQAIRNELAEKPTIGAVVPYV